MPNDRMLHNRMEPTRRPLTAVAQIARRRTIREKVLLGFVTLIFLAVAILSSHAFGQAAKFDEIKIDPALLADESMRSMDRARKEAPGKRDASPGTWPQWNAFSAYYNQYLFAKMTQPDELGNLPAMNEEILKDLRRAQSIGANDAARAILSWSTRNATALATGNYHPGVRINATLLLGELNDEPPGAMPPKPAQATLGPLVGLYRDPTAPEGVRAAALLGIHRWVRYGLERLNPNARKGIVTMMLALANEPTPANRTPAGHAYMQRLALDMLQVLYSPADGDAIAQAFATLSSSRESPKLVSLYATAKMPQLKGLAKLDGATDVAKAWTNNVADVFESEAARLEAMNPPPPAAGQYGPVQPKTSNNFGGSGMGSEYGMDGSMEEGLGMDARTAGGGGDMEAGMDERSMMGDMGEGAMGYPGMGGVGSAKTQPPEVFAARRRLVHALECVRLGLNGTRLKEAPRSPAGLAKLIPAEEQLATEQLNEKLLAVLEEINKKEHDTREKFAKVAATQGKELRTLAGHLGKEPEEDAAPEVEPGVNPLFPGAPPGGFGSPFASP